MGATGDAIGGTDATGGEDAAGGTAGNVGSGAGAGCDSFGERLCSNCVKPPAAGELEAGAIGGKSAGFAGVAGVSCSAWNNCVNPP